MRCAGNIIVQNESGTFGTQTGDSRPIRIYPAAGGEAVDITLILPSMGVTCGRSDFFGKASGNVLSEEGGTFYLLCANSPYVYILPIKNGAQDVDNMNAVDVSVAFENSNDGTLKGTASTQTIAYEYDGDIIIHERKCGVKRSISEKTGNATKVKDYTIVPLKEETESMTCFPTDMVGSCFFTIGDEDYLVYSQRYYSTEVAYEFGLCCFTFERRRESGRNEKSRNEYFGQSSVRTVVCRSTCFRYTSRDLSLFPGSRSQ